MSVPRKKLYTREELDHAIDYALRCGDHVLDELYGRKRQLENIIKMLKKEYTTVCTRIDECEKERNTIQKESD